MRSVQAKQRRGEHKRKEREIRRRKQGSGGAARSTIELLPKMSDVLVELIEPLWHGDVRQAPRKTRQVLRNPISVHPNRSVSCL